MFTKEFEVENDKLIVGDLLTPGKYVELDNPYRGKWRYIPTFHGKTLKAVIVTPVLNQKENSKLGEIIKLDVPSGYVGVYDKNHYADGTLSEETHDTIIEMCDKDKQSGYAEGGIFALLTSNNPELQLVVDRNYSGEIISVIIS